MVRVPAHADEALEHRLLRLLGLQEQRVLAVAPEQQDDPGARADAPDAHDLAGHVHHAEVVEQVSPVVRERPAVAPDDAGERAVERVAVHVRELLDRDDQGRVADDARLAVDLVGELREGVHAVLRPRLREVLLEGLDALLVELRSVTIGISSSMSIFEYQTSRFFMPAALVMISRYWPHARQHDLRPRRVVPAVVAPGDLEARREPLHVPLPRTGERLVEVVHVEDQPSLGRAEHPEVRQVGIAADLDVQSGARCAGQVRGHDERRTPVEGERRDHHPAVADRHELGNPRRSPAPRAARSGPAGVRWRRTRHGSTAGPRLGPPSRARRAPRASDAPSPLDAAPLDDGASGSSVASSTLLRSLM